MRVRLLAATLCSATTVISVLAVPALTVPAQAKAPSMTLRVASFNIRSVSFDRKSTKTQKWRYRRSTIVSQILGQRPDVVGLQEANQSSVYHASLDFGVNQFMDLKNALVRRGGHYSVTNRSAYNCLRATSSTRCTFRNRGAAQDDRILYNPLTVTMVSRGSVKYRHQAAGKNPRYFEWAVFRSRRTGKQFFFGNTHLDPYSTPVRRAQWGELITSVNRLEHGLPVVVVGDFNTSKFDAYSATYVPRMKANGYGDVLNQSYRQPVVKVKRAASMVDGWINSFNGWKRDIRSYAYEDAKNKVGNGIDWIFATNRLHVSQWETVADVNTRTNKLTGRIPSDHNMVRATLVLK